MVGSGGRTARSGLTAVVTVPDHSRPDVTIIEGRIWACEWSGSPSPAVISVDGGPS